jgi:hypothetical protein
MESILKLEQSTKIGMSIINSLMMLLIKRMPNIKAGANRYKTKGKATDSDPLRDALAYLLEKV